MFRKFSQSRSGNFAVMFAFTLPVAVGAAGLGLDVIQMRKTASEVQQMTDAAVLAATRKGLTDAEREKVFQDHLRSYVSEDSSYSLLRTKLTTEEGTNHIEVTGDVTVDVETFFLHRTRPEPLRIVAAAYQSTKQVELTLVLDNTGSMGQNGIDTLKGAALGLIDVLDSGVVAGKDIKVGLVPFVTAVNINGEGFDPSWIDEDGQALYNGWTFLDDEERERRGEGVPTDWADDKAARNEDDDDDDDEDDDEDNQGQACNNQGQSAQAEAKRAACRERVLAELDYPHQAALFEVSGTEWKGCIEARPYPLNLSLAAPDPEEPDTLFVPYFAPDEPGSATFSGGNDSGSFNNTWLDDAASGNLADVQRSVLKYIDPAVTTVEEAKSLSRGPNRACPTPIVPLSRDLSKVRDGINAMKYWNGSGTNIAEGLTWGWRVVTPDAPYTEASALDPENVSKFVVLMTDGRNVSFGSSGTMNKSDYGSYGFLADGRITGTSSQSQAERKLNEWTLEVCNKMKEQQIEIFTVLYKETNKGVQDLLRSCASKPTNFHMASNTAGLEAAFANIGRDMSPLRLIR